MSAHELGPQLLNGCCIEAERAGRVAIGLQGLRDTLPIQYHPHLTGVIDEAHTTGRLLRDLADLTQVHISRVPVVIDYLNVILPCLCRTLYDITTFYEDRTKSKERRWRAMYHKLSNELPGTSLPARFIMYNSFLTYLHLMLARSPNFDLNALESLRIRIMELRSVRGIPPPSPVDTRELIRHNPAMESLNQPTNDHWAESIFTRPLATRREFRISRHSRSRSEAYGPLQQLGRLPMPPHVKILMKKTFDNDRIAVVFFLKSRRETPTLFIRCMHHSQSWVSMFGVHELCISRVSASVLEFARWSHSEQRSKPWARLKFITWEEMVLFYCTFVCLKARCPNTIEVDPKEFFLRKEKRLFQAQIIDDGFSHSLMVYKDRATGGLRLHAAVWEGELRQCPVWTAFLTPSKTPDSWIIQKSDHRIWVRDIEPYTFCSQYHPERQRKNRPGAFQLVFVKPEAATRFKEIFMPTPEPTSIVGSEDVDDVDEADDDD